MSYSKYLETLIQRGGPQPQDYAELDAWIAKFYSALDAGELPCDAQDKARSVFSQILSQKTMHGFAYTKPHGYAGDFEIIDKHYLTEIAPEPHLATWDRYWHYGAAARAVRNRKSYFHDLLHQHLKAASGRHINVLNVASGPCRDVFEFLSSGTHNIHFDCIEQDANAIAYASSLCCDFSAQITFANADVLRFQPHKSYDLIWAAGLFDYFSDGIFKRTLRRLLPGLAQDGELVIGNFSTANPNIHWLRFCNWLLHHRNQDHLVFLATEAGALAENIRIRQEPTGVNLFLHITQPRFQPNFCPEGQTPKLS